MTTRTPLVALLLVAGAVLAGPPAKPRPAPPPDDADVKVDRGGRPQPLPDGAIRFQTSRPAPQPKALPPRPPLALRAERVEKPAPAPRLVSESMSGHFALTADGAALVYLDGAGLFAVPPREGTPRQLGPVSPYFTLSADGRYAVVPGAAWKRLDVSGKNGPIDLAKAEQAHALSGFATSATHLAFITAAGPMAVTSFEEGTSVRLPVEPPKSAQCHAGAGYPRAFSADGRWLLYQSGCESNDLIRPDGSGRRRTGLVSALFVADVLAGNARDETKPGSGLPAPPLKVVPLDGSAPWAVPDVVMSPMPKALPGRRAFVQTDAKSVVWLVDLDAKKARVLYEGGRATNFLEPTPDGKRVLFGTQADGRCAVHQVDVASGKHQQLAVIEGAQQCFIKPAGPTRAVLYAWSASSREDGEAVLAAVDLDTGVVTPLGPPLRGVGNFHVAGHAYAVSAGSRLYAGAL